MICNIEFKFEFLNFKFKFQAKVIMFCYDICHYFPLLWDNDISLCLWPNVIHWRVTQVLRNFVWKSLFWWKKYMIEFNPIDWALNSKILFFLEIKIIGGDILQNIIILFL